MIFTNLNPEPLIVDIIPKKNDLKIGCGLAGGLLVVTATCIALSILFPPSAIFLYPIAILFGMLGMSMSVNNARALDRLGTEPSITDESPNNSQKPPIEYTVKYELHLTEDSEIPGKLISQMEHGMRQMEEEKDNVNFKYICSDASEEWKQNVLTKLKVGECNVGIASWQGHHKNAMEDEHLAIPFNLSINGKEYFIQLFGVFDGHGGKKAAEYVRDNLSDTLKQNLQKYNENGLSDQGIWQALKLTPVHLDHGFKKEFDEVFDGTTATIAMILDGKIWTINVGDSRTVLDNSGEAIQLSEDAKPSDLRYRDKIVRHHGEVKKKRLMHPNNKEIHLGVARAIGDNLFGAAVSARPKITVKALSEVNENSHLILCCDGIYDVASTRQVVKAVHENNKSSVGDLALNLMFSAHYAGSKDNFTAMVIKIK
jgi:protein phosphatase 1L